VIGGIFLQGLRKISEDPPYKGQRTRWGKRLEGEFVDEGWHFFLLYPFFDGFVPVKMERVTFKVVSEKTRTPDRADSKVPVSVTFRPDSSLLITYLNNGGEEGIKKQLEGMVMKRIREWASGNEEGPATWVELNQSQAEAASVLVRKIVGKHLTDIGDGPQQEVPTWIWLRYFSRPRPTKHSENEKIWADPDNSWKKVTDVIKKIEDAQPGSSTTLEKKVGERRKEISELQQGTARISLPDLGIILERLNLEDIDVLGEVAKVAESEAREEQERKAEDLELKFVRERIAELMLPPFNYDKGEARDIVQTERGKVVRAIKDNKISVDATTAEMVVAIMGRKP